MYAINDVCDAAEDRRHPRKCTRPVAAGEISAGVALLLGSGVTGAGLAICADLSWLLALVGGGYVVLTFTYTVLWRRIIVLDLVAVAGGFVLRAVAGGVAAHVGLSRWFVLVVSAAAVCLASSKRLAERRRTSRDGSTRRRVLDRYSRTGLIVVIGGSATIALAAYCAWALGMPAIASSPSRALTIGPFTACLMRYLALVHRGGGEAPEELLLSDAPLLLTGCVWLALFGLAVNAA
jgi:decaprenyl-phosphate phosphoribosyltransferase